MFGDDELKHTIPFGFSEGSFMNRVRVLAKYNEELAVILQYLEVRLRSSLCGHMRSYFHAIGMRMDGPNNSTYCIRRTM
jgi:hypothetical protein